MDKDLNIPAPDDMPFEYDVDIPDDMEFVIFEDEDDFDDWDGEEWDEDEDGI